MQQSSAHNSKTPYENPMKAIYKYINSLIIPNSKFYINYSTWVEVDDTQAFN